MLKLFLCAALLCQTTTAYARPSLRSLKEDAVRSEETEAGWRMQFFTWDAFGLRGTYPASWRDPLITKEDRYTQARLIPQDNTLGQRKNYLLELTALVWPVGYELSVGALEEFARTESPARFHEYYVLSATGTTLAGYPAWTMRLSTMTGPREETWVSVGPYVYTLGFRSRNDEYFAADHFFYEDYLDSVKIAPVEETEESEEAEEVEATMFTDVSASYPYKAAIQWAKESGVVGGYPDGSFRPEQTVNRAELLKMLLQAAQTDIPAVSDAPFPDITLQDWFAPFVSAAKRKAIIQGYPDGTFRPAQTVNTAEALKMIYKTLNVDTSAVNGPWYQEFLDHAKNHGILFKDLAPSEGMKRQDIVWILWRLLQ